MVNKFQEIPSCPKCSNTNISFIGKVVKGYNLECTLKCIKCNSLYRKNINLKTLRWRNSK